MSLGGVFDDVEAMSLGQLEDWAHVRGLTGEVDWHDRLRPLRQCSLDLLRVDVVRLRIAIDEYNVGTDARDGQGSRNVGVRGHDDLVAGADFQRRQGQTESVETAADTDAVSGFDEVGKRSLETCDLVTENVCGRRCHIMECTVNLLLDRDVLRHQIDERNYLELLARAG